MKLIISVFLILFTFSNTFSQTKEIYTNPDFARIAKNHKTLAILPFKTIMNLRPKQMQSMSQEAYNQILLDEGKAVQNALYTYFLKEKGKDGFIVSFQDISKTNTILTRNFVDEVNIYSYTMEELSELLGVDGIISGILQTDKPMSDGASVAMGLLIGYYGNTNSGKCTINVHDGQKGKLLWKYEKTLSRSLGSDTNTIINAMMRKASRKFPYSKI
ncbi:hypothetical protein BH23BAC1_BH23BAC1_35340 [soil metagenome]